ncbi:ATP-grasp domain-containing protein [Myxococcus sp. K15C18031901]|uniref:ATP-grasp domain-containing protein n=1 Tax=Myxococcus dinghuensis TaxID=2906761 RepID=UPI0020A73302|nr:ATP-grasp domain-containing protein [Myxococcus dinghuensis]MCP3102884.1 ATP-grasp domain-containing protein [Myxococcus dinghuensis]
MSKMLILARGDGRAFIGLQGRSILEGLPFPVVVFVDKANVEYFPGVDTEVVRWRNPDDISKAAAKRHAEHGIFAVATLDEQMVDLAARLRTELGVGGARPEEARRFRDKVLMKKLLREAGVRVPEHASCADRAAVEALLAKHRRLALKPVDGQGSRDVSFAASPEQLDAWYAKNLPSASFEAEEFIDGVLYHVNAIVRDGVPLVTASAPYLPGMANIDFAAGTPFVSVMLTEGELKERLEALSTRVVEVLRLGNGVTHMECFVTAQGEIVFLEIAARPGGGGIVLMMEGQYGVNYSQALLLLEGGRGDLIPPIGMRAGQTHGLMGFRQPVAGFVKRAATPDMFSEPWIHHVRIDLELEKFQAPASHCTDFTGLLIFSSRDTAEFDARRTALFERYHAALEIKPLQASPPPNPKGPNP